MQRQWFVKRGLSEYGPFSSKQIRQFARDGHVQGLDLLRCEGTQEWFAVDSVEALLPSKPRRLVPHPSLGSKPQAPERDKPRLKNWAAHFVRLVATHET